MPSNPNKATALKGLLLSLICVIAASCSNRPEADTPQTARQALENNQPEVAQQICESLSEPGSFDRLDARCLCELSSVLMDLADVDRRESNIAMATKCLEKAYTLDSASVNRYIDAQPIEKRADLQTVISLLGALDSTKRPELLLEIDSENIDFGEDSVY